MYFPFSVYLLFTFDDDSSGWLTRLGVMKIILNIEIRLHFKCSMSSETLTSDKMHVYGWKDRTMDD